MIVDFVSFPASCSVLLFFPSKTAFVFLCRYFCISYYIKKTISITDFLIIKKMEFGKFITDEYCHWLFCPFVGCTKQHVMMYFIVVNEFDKFDTC